MQKAIIIPQDEYEKIPAALVKALLENAKLKYGVKFFRCEDGGEIVHEHELLGALSNTFNKVLGTSTR